MFTVFIVSSSKHKHNNKIKMNCENYQCKENRKIVRHFNKNNEFIEFELK